MTADEINRAIAEACGTHDRWVLKKRGLYYRPHAKGYTYNLSEAWLCAEAEADEHVYPHDEPVTKHPAPIPNYCGDLNVMHEAESAMPLDQQNRLAYVLRQLLGFHSHSYFDLVHASAQRRAEAFLRTIGKWKEGVAETLETCDTPRKET